MSTLPAGRRGNYCLPGTIKQGYLTKSPPLEKKSLMKHWKKRWCILVMTSSNNEPCLDYYRDEADTYNSLPIKRISLAQCSKVEMDLKHSNYKHVFAIHLPERVFYFAAPSDFEMREWADVLCAHLKLCDTSEHDGFPSPLRYHRGGSPPLKPRMAYSLDRSVSPNLMKNVPHYGTSPNLRCSMTPPPRNFSTSEQGPLPPPPPPHRSTTPTASTRDDKPPLPHSTTPPTLANDELPPTLRRTSSDEVCHSLPTSHFSLQQETPSTMHPPPPPSPRSTTPTPSTSDDKVLPPPWISPPPPLPPRPEVLRHSGSSSIVYGTC